MSIGERIKTALGKAGKSQADLARHLDTNNSTVTGWIKGRVPSADVIMPICEFTGVTEGWLLAGKETPPNITLETRIVLPPTQETYDFLSKYIQSPVSVNPS